MFGSHQTTATWHLASEILSMQESFINMSARQESVPLSQKAAQNVNKVSVLIFERSSLNQVCTLFLCSVVQGGSHSDGGGRQVSKGPGIAMCCKRFTSLCGLPTLSTACRSLARNFFQSQHQVQEDRNHSGDLGASL